MGRLIFLSSFEYWLFQSDKIKFGSKNVAKLILLNLFQCVPSNNTHQQQYVWLIKVQLIKTTIYKL